MDTDAIQPQPAPATPARPERRRSDRYTAEDAMTALGAMIDISRTGLSVLATTQPPLTPGDRFRIEVRHDQRIALFPAELVYADRRAAEALLESGQPGVKLGLKFGRLTPAQQREVQTIMDRGIKIPHLEIAWDMASLDGQADDTPSDDDDDETTVYAPNSSALPDDALADAVPDAGCALDQLDALRDQADDLHQMIASPCADPDDLADPAEPPDRCDDAEQSAVAVKPSSAWTRTLGATVSRAATPGEVNQRRAGRIVAADASCSLGTIVDMSAGGMCVQRKGAAPVRVGSAFMVDLHLAGRVLRAPVEVMRIQKIGWRTFEYGLKFGDWPDDIRAEFGRLVRMASKATTVR